MSGATLADRGDQRGRRQAATVPTALGPIATTELGPTLLHEHIEKRSLGVKENRPLPRSENVYPFEREFAKREILSGSARAHIVGACDDIMRNKQSGVWLPNSAADPLPTAQNDTEIPLRARRPNHI